MSKQKEEEEEICYNNPTNTFEKKKPNHSQQSHPESYANAQKCTFANKQDEEEEKSRLERWR